jgi:hypothetical protein
MTSGGNHRIPRKLLVFMRKNGAGDEIRTHDFNLGKSGIFGATAFHGVTTWVSICLPFAGI